MCIALNIGTRDPDIDFIEFDTTALIEKIFNSLLGPDLLPRDLFDNTFFELAQHLSNEFGLPSDFESGSIERLRSTAAKRNLGIFSGAKTFQNVFDLSLLVFDDNGNKRPFAEFAIEAQKINKTYNLDWLRTEQNAAFRQSQAIESWLKIEAQKDIFPLLRYSTVADARVREEHRLLDQFIQPVDSPFWDHWFPPNGFNCRCIVEQLRTGIITEIPKEFDINDDPNFGTNVGKTGLIFSEDHPYNEVPREFRRSAANNFGFTIPTDQDIRTFLN